MLKQSHKKKFLEILRVFFQAYRFLLVSVIIVVLAFSDISSILSVPHIPLTPQVHTAEATTGDFAIFRESAGTDSISSTTVTDMKWDTTVQSNSNITLQGNNYDIDLGESGHYLALYNIATEEGTSTQTNRRNIETFLTLAGTELPYGRDTAYMRDSETLNTAYNAGAAIINATAGDDLSVKVTRDDLNGDAGVNLMPDASGISILKLRDSWDYLRITRDSTTTNISGNTSFTDVLWTHEDEVDTGSFGFTATSSNITLSGGDGKHFLVTANVHLFMDATSNTRQNYEMRLTLDGAEIPGTRVTAYPRGNPNSNGIYNATLVYTGIIAKDAAGDQLLNVEYRRESSGSATTYIVGDRTALSIVALPDTAEFIRLTDDSGSQTTSLSRTAMNWNVQEEVDSTAFSHSTTTNSSRIEIDAADDFLFFSTVYSTTTTSGQERQPHRIDWRKNGSSLVQYGIHDGYNRASQAFSAGSSGGVILDGLGTLDYVEITHIDETSDAPVDATFGNSLIAIQGVRLADSLFGADVNVAATGTQVASIEIPHVNNYLGGAFSIVENSSSRNVTSIKLTETGSVDASAGLKNIKLLYDLDTSAPYDCASESYSGNESQFGSTDTNGFSGPNGVSSFSGVVSITTTQTLCVYPVFDVATSSSDGETVDIEISDPSADVVVSGGGSVIPGTAEAITGSTTLRNAELTQSHFHWREDDGSEAGASSASGGSEDIAIGGFSSTTIRRLRMGISNQGSIVSPNSVHILDDFSTGNTKTISSGANRLLIVGIHSEDTLTRVNVGSVTYGGQTLTEIDDEQVGGGASNGMWVGYLDEAGIAAATGNTISPTWVGGTPDTAQLFSSVVLENVDQTDPVTGWSGNTGTSVSTIQPTTTIPVATGDMALYFSVSGSGGETHTPAANYTEGSEEDNQSVAANAYREITSPGTEQPTADWTNSQNRLAMVALSVKLGGNRFRLEYAQKDTTCSVATGWLDVASTTGDWDIADSPNLTDGNNTTDIAEATGGVTNVGSFISPNGGVKDTSSQTGTTSLDVSEFIELEYSIIPTATASEGNSYCFRVTDAGFPLRNYSVYAEGAISADVTVSATSSQIASTTVPISDFYVGGAFVIQETSLSRNVTDITITETGSVNASSSLTNIRMYYDLDTSAPYDCASESYTGPEPQFGATSTGFSSENGTTTFSGTQQVTTTQAMCVYVVLDINASTTDQETLDIEISAPNNDVGVSSGTVGPGSAVGMTGSTTLHARNLAQEHIHWRNDNGSESGATSATGGSEDTALLSIQKESPYRLRLGISNTGATTSGAAQYRLEYGTKITSCSAIAEGSWTDVGDSGGAWDMFDSTNLTDGNNTTDIAEATGGVTNVGSFVTPNSGVKDTSSQTGDVTLLGGEFVELEYSIEATVDSGFETSYCFRVTDNAAQLNSYNTYAEASIAEKRDFKIQRGTVTIETGQTATTLTAGTDYVAPSASTSAFIRITNTGYTGAGENADNDNNKTPDGFTAYIENPSDILTSINIVRPSSAANSVDTRVSWEIVEFIGTSGTDNEMIVRDNSTVTYGTSNTFATGTSVSGISDDNDVVVFITGQYNPDGTNNDSNTGLSTSLWWATTSEPVFERGETGSDAARVSYAVVEFVGQNWHTFRIEHTYSAVDTTETEDIPTEDVLGSISKAFIHSQHRAGTAQDGLAEFNSEVWLSGVSQVSFHLSPDAANANLNTVAVWVIENTQSGVGSMVVTRSNGSVAGGAEPSAYSQSIGKTLDSLSNSSIFVNNRSTGGGQAFPRPILGATIVSTTDYELWSSDTGQTKDFRTEIVEWPTVELAIRQNHYRFYVDNDALDPTDPWPAGASDLGEDTSITITDQPLGEGDAVRIRMTLVISNSTFPASTKAFKLQYGLRNSSCSAVSVDSSWIDVGAAGSGIIWRGYDGSPADGTALSGDPPTGGDLNISVADVAGTYEEENDSVVNPFAVSAGEDVEYDWVIEHNGATEKSEYCFRAVESDDTELAGYNFYPTVRTAGYGPLVANWRWYDDEASETPVTPLAATNSAPIDIANDNLIKLRTTVAEVAGAPGTNVKFKLQYSEYSDFSTVNDVVGTSTCQENSIWCYADGAGIENAVVNATVLADADACSGGVGNGCGTHNEATTSSSFTHAADAVTEYEFTLQHAGARTNAVYYFRLYDTVNDAPVAASTSNPSLVTEGATLVSTSGSISSSTVIEGITTDIDTTPTSVAFGDLTIDTEIEGAQRFTISTNATEGYKIFVYARSDLTSSGGLTIDNVTGTNASPSAWTTGCSVSASGCFGYHSGDDILDGGSTRFSANDTYAQFDTTPQEVIYSSIPVTNEVTDIVYKLQVGELQEAGQYETEIVYITVPVF